ncbi:MAG: FG-GAP-like repeat-containing protein [Bacteroidales bacterium]
MKKQFSLIVLILITLKSFTQDLSVITSNLPSNTNSILLSGDIDNDGLMDVFVSGINTGTKYARLYKNLGDSTFLNLGVSISPLSDAAACFADLNNDNWLDLIYTGVNSSNVKVFLLFINQKNNTFSALSNSIPGIRYGSVECYDLNNDGWNDVFFSGYSDSGTTCRLYKNNGDLTFTLEPQTFQGIYDGDIVFADFNNDALTDIMYSGYHSATYKPKSFYYLNTGNFSFSLQINAFPATTNGDLDICDINNDGFTDILISGKEEDGNLITHAYKNNYGVSFIYHSQVAGVQNGTLKSGDFNNDGFADLFISGEIQSGDFTTEFYLNNGSGGFIIETDTLKEVTNSAMNWIDFNNDNKLDILYSGNSFAQAEIFLLSSNNAVSNNSPLTPDNLKSILTENNDSVVLSWYNATDFETVAPGLSYDIYLFDANSGVPVFYPIVDLSTGKRKINQIGNIKDTSILIKGLFDGKYYWSVQSVDAAFAGSPFATADTFYISSPIDLGNDTVICSGDTISFAFPAFEGDFKWYHSLNPDIPLGTIKEIEIKINQRDTIWVEITKAYGDMIYDTIIVDIHSLPVVNLGDDIFACYGSNVEFSLGTEPEIVNWFTLSEIYQDNDIHIFNHVFYSNDEIVAQLTDIYGCTNSDTVILSIRSLPEINLVNDTSLCLKNTLQLNIGTASDSINWYSLTDASQSLNSNAFEYIVLQNNTFQIEWYDEYRCVNYDTIHVFARALPIPDAGNDKLICGGYSVNLGPEILNDNYTYLWSPVLSIDDINSANPLVTPLADTEYFLHVTDQFGCQANDSVLVQINPIGTFNIGNDTSICPGEETILGGNPTAIGSILPYSFEWSPTEYLSGFTTANPVVSPKETTTYSLIIYTGDCPVDTLETTVTISPLPTITIMNDTIAGFQEDIALWVLGGVEYEWTPAEYLDNHLSQNPVANLESTTYFTVQVTNEFGCSDTAGVTIYIKNEIYIPELFTPNDDGNNDFFKVYGFGIKQLSLTIFDDNGLNVFESSDLLEITNNGWNGNSKGNMVKDGKYFWKINGEYYDGTKVLFKGRDTGVITILR